MRTRYPILNSPIPFGGFGRPLTSSECKALRAQGISCSERWIVLRRCDSPTCGILYSRDSGRGRSFTNEGIIVERI